MAYTVESIEDGSSGTDVTTFTPSKWFSSAQQDGDYILIVVAKDGSNSFTTPTGWTALFGGSLAPGASTVGFYYRKHTGTDITAPSIVATGGNEEWAFQATLIRDADATTFIDASNYTSYASSHEPTCPSVNSTTANGLVLRITAGDVGVYATSHPINAWGDAILVGRTIDDTASALPECEVVTNRQLQAAAGATGTYQWKRFYQDDCICATIVVRNAAGGGIGSNVASTPTIVEGYTRYYNDRPTFTSLHGRVSTINGLTVQAATTSVRNSINHAVNVEDWHGAFLYADFSNSSGSAGIVGGYHTLTTSVDLTDGIYILTTRNYLTSSTQMQGLMLYFEDTAGNWAVWNPVPAGPDLAWHTLIGRMENVALLDESAAAIDWTDVKYLGYAYEVDSSSVPARIYLRWACHVPDASPLTLTGGNAANPVTPRDAVQALKTGVLYDISAAQGLGQNLVGFPLRIGDGSAATYFKAEAHSLEYPIPATKVGYEIAATEQNVFIKASAADTIDFAAGIMATGESQYFTIDAASSLSATYNFSGSFVGWIVTWLDGLDCNGASFITCGAIDGKAAAFNGLTVSGSVATTAALEIDNGADVTNSDFTQGLETYAIEIREAGDYDFSGNTYTGYTTDVYISATTGTVNITVNGGQTPTTATAGATVNVVSTPSALTITSDVTATIRYFEAGSQTVIDSTTGTSLDYEYTDTDPIDIEIVAQGYIPIRRANVTPYDGDYAVTLTSAPIYDAAHGLTYTTDYTYNRTTKVLTLVGDTEMRAAYSALQDLIRTDAGFYNTDFLMVAIGPDRFDLMGGMTVADATKVKGAGGCWFASGDSDNPTHKFISIKSVGTIPAGSTCHYAQQDGGTPQALTLSGSNLIDEVIQYYSDPDHDGTPAYDYSGHLVFKAHKNGYYQARADVLVAFGLTALEPYEYTLAMALVETGLTTGNPGISLSITDHTASPLVVGGKSFDYEIVAPTGATAETVLRQLNYDLSADPTATIYTSYTAFDLPDILIESGGAYETENGHVEGQDTTTTLHGFYVSRDAADHPGVARFESNDGTYYTPSPLVLISAPNFMDGTHYLLRYADDWSEISYGTVSGGAGLNVYVTYTSDRPLELKWSGPFAANPVSGYLLGRATQTLKSTGAEFLNSNEENTWLTKAAQMQGDHALGTTDLSTISEFSLDLSEQAPSLQVEAVDTDNVTNTTRMYCWAAYLAGHDKAALTAFSPGILEPQGTTAYLRFNGSVTIKNERVGQPLEIYGIAERLDGENPLQPDNGLSMNGGVTPAANVSIGDNASLDVVKQALTEQGYTTTRAPKLDNVDVATSTRLAAADYTAPDNAGISTAATAAQAAQAAAEALPDVATIRADLEANSELSVDVAKINGAPVIGTGQESDQWRGAGV